MMRKLGIKNGPNDQNGGNKVYICSFRLSTVRFISVIGLSVLALLTLLMLVPSDRPAALIEQTAKIDYTDADTSEGRAHFASQFGWELSMQSETADDVIIPSVFDDVYTGYNAIQKAQGLNLEKYRGKTVQRYTYLITNYPDVEEQVILTMLVYHGRVIGGDVSSVLQNGFCHGFSKPSDSTVSG